MTYDEWETNQGISPISPEAYFAELAWNAAANESASICMMQKPEDGSAESEDYSVATVDCAASITLIKTGLEMK